MIHLFYPCLFVLGLIIGSFLNVCIWRLPRHESLVMPFSRCPKCLNPIRFYDNIPIASFIILGGRCRYCGDRISFQYPLVESITSMLFLIVGWRFGPSWALIPYLFFTASLVAIAFIDIEHLIIPDRISLPGIVLGFLISFLPFMHVGRIDSLIGIFLCGGAFYLVDKISLLVWKREGMGGGDMKLIAMVGAFLGWRGGVVTIFLASLLGSIWGILMIILKKKGRMDTIPFGPFICLGALISLLYGREMIWWYQGFFVP
ncbi:prepilin peptidase [bacterium]|nr:prepilin peptidase [bacterium]